MIRCAIYPRKSKQINDSDSMETQIAMCKQYLDTKYGKNNYSVTVYDKDYGITGHTTNKRKDFQRMMQDVKDKKIELVLIQRYDRIARNTRDFCNIYHDMEINGCNLVSVSQQIDTTTPYGKKFMYDQASMAELEWALCSERRKDANKYARSIGKCTLSDHCITFGYKAEKVDGVRRMVKDKEVEHIVIDMFDHLSKYANFSACARYLNEKYGTRFMNKTISNISRRTFYYGEYDGNTNFCEPYISKEEWQSFQEKKPAIRNDPKKKTEALFTGMMRCPVCKRKIRSGQKSKPNGKTYRYYHCERHIARLCEWHKVKSEKILESQLINFLKNYITNIDVNAKEQEEKNRQLKDNTDALKQELERLNNMYLKGRISELFYDTEYLRLNDLISLNQAYTQEERHLNNVKSILVDDWIKSYEELDKLHRKLFWRELIHEIILDEEANVIDVIFL